MAHDQKLRERLEASPVTCRSTPLLIGDKYRFDAHHQNDTMSPLDTTLYNASRSLEGMEEKPHL